MACICREARKLGPAVNPSWEGPVGRVVSATPNGENTSVIITHRDAQSNGPEILREIGLGGRLESLQKAGFYKLMTSHGIERRRKKLLFCQSFPRWILTQQMEHDVEAKH